MVVQWARVFGKHHVGFLGLAPQGIETVDLKWIQHHNGWLLSNPPDVPRQCQQDFFASWVIIGVEKRLHEEWIEKKAVFFFNYLEVELFSEGGRQLLKYFRRPIQRENNEGARCWMAQVMTPRMCSSATAATTTTVKSFKNVCTRSSPTIIRSW